MDLVRQAALLISEARHLTAFTGAGISVESGVPPFRGADGLWSKYDPGILDIDKYMNKPEQSWPVIKELFYDFFGKAKPNPAHYFLSFLEEKEILKSLITQNIDNLHQEAGSKNVIEYHGNSMYLVCTECGDRIPVSLSELTTEAPRCRHDGSLMKPDFVFFGEAIPSQAASISVSEADKSDLMIIIGTTGEVMPASLIPDMVKRTGGRIIEINTNESKYTDTITDIYLEGRAGEICAKLKELL